MKTVIADIFRDWQKTFLCQNNVAKEVVRAIFDIIKCKTSDMGRGIFVYCPDCGFSKFYYQSCGNRNCPQCGHQKISKWLEKRQAEMLAVNYFMVTFTLPHEFNYYFKLYPAKMVNLFFAAASQSLHKIGERKLKGQIGFMMVYQSWRRDGGFHPHIHCLIPGVALSKNKQYCLFPKKREFLFSAKPLSALFKGKFNSMLKDLPENIKAQQQVIHKKYVVDIKCVGNSMSSFKYLAAYTQRGFISNDRILNYDGQNVIFSYTESATGKKHTRKLTALKFMSLYFQHVMPKAFQRIRYYGFWGAAARKNLNAIQEILSGETLEKYESQKTEYLSEYFDIKNESICPICKASMQVKHQRGPPRHR